jgi:hypothetical protein
MHIIRYQSNTHSILLLRSVWCLPSESTAGTGVGLMAQSSQPSPAEGPVVDRLRRHDGEFLRVAWPPNYFMQTVFPAKGCVDDWDSMNQEAANQDIQFTLRSRDRKRKTSNLPEVKTWLLISGPEGLVLKFYHRLRQVVTLCMGTGKGLPPRYRVRLQSITQGQVQAAQIDTTAAISHKYLPADTGEGVRADVDADVASDASDEDPSLNHSLAARRSSRAHAGDQAPTANTHHTEAGISFLKAGFSSEDFDTRALHELVFRAAKALEVSLLE